MKFEIFDRFSRNIQLSIFMKICPVVDTRTNGRTDGRLVTAKLIVPFRNFVNAPKNKRTLKSDVILNASIV